jgi:hypothetical protein
MGVPSVGLSLISLYLAGLAVTTRSYRWPP